MEDFFDCRSAMGYVYCLVKQFVNLQSVQLLKKQFAFSFSHSLSLSLFFVVFTHSILIEASETKTFI